MTDRVRLTLDGRTVEWDIDRHVTATLAQSLVHTLGPAHRDLSDYPDRPIPGDRLDNVPDKGYNSERDSIGAGIDPVLKALAHATQVRIDELKRRY